MRNLESRSPSSSSLLVQVFICQTCPIKNFKLTGKEKNLLYRNFIAFFLAKKLGTDSGAFGVVVDNDFDAVKTIVI